MANTRRWIASILLFFGATLVVLAGTAAHRDLATRVAAAKQTQTVLSPVYTVDRKYRSMMGPYSEQDLLLAEEDEPDLLWITGYEAVMVGADGDRPMAQDFMCHSNLDIDVVAHEKVWGSQPTFNPRLFTLSQGQFSVRFPDGFGIPMLSDEALSLTTQVLNHNHEGAQLEVRHKVTVEYVKNRDVGSGMKALLPTSAYGLVLLEGEDGYFAVPQPNAEEHGPGCLPGESASDHAYNDGLGRQFSGHWVVAPGHQVNRTLVTHLMRLSYDTTVHYIAVHLHPFAVSLELRDLTTGTSVFKSAATNLEDRIGLARVDYFTSAEGLPVYRDHEYEIVSEYLNTTDEDQDSMAVMYLYVRDLEFEQNWNRHGRKHLRELRKM